VSTASPPGEDVDVPGAAVHAAAKSPAMMSSDRVDHNPLLRRMHCLLLIRAYSRAWVLR
jgi:hypothetical protein